MVSKVSILKSLIIIFLGPLCDSLKDSILRISFFYSLNLISKTFFSVNKCIFSVGDEDMTIIAGTTDMSLFLKTFLKNYKIEAGFLYWTYFHTYFLKSRKKRRVWAEDHDSLKNE